MTTQNKLDSLQICLKGWIADNLPQNTERKERVIAELENEIEVLNEIIDRPYFNP